MKPIRAKWDDGFGEKDVFIMQFLFDHNGDAKAIVRTSKMKYKIAELNSLTEETYQP